MSLQKANTVQYSLLQDIGLLVKFKLSLTVLLSSVLAYVMFSSNNFSWASFSLLIIGGTLVTFAANALNQVLERDYDKLMDRTSMRPLPESRMSVSFAVLLAGVFCTLGVVALSMINPLSGFLGMISLIIYAFVYTPLKRYSTVAVPVGAVPGALPVLIGAVAAQGNISIEAFCLFGIQYLWQFPHFWAIAWMGHDDYTKAGFKLIRDIDGKPDARFGLYSALYAALSLLFVGIYFTNSNMTIGILIALILLIAIYVYYSFLLFQNNDKPAAKKLFFYSLLYLPLILILFTINNKLF